MVTITTQPTNQSVVAGQNRQFRAQATGTAPVTFQWQVSTDGGTTWNNVANGGVYTGATTNNLTITGATAVLNNHQFLVIVTDATVPPSPVTSTAATLTVTPATTGAGTGGTTAGTTPATTAATTAAPAGNTNTFNMPPVVVNNHVYGAGGRGGNNGLGVAAIAIAILAVVIVAFLTWGKVGGVMTTATPGVPPTVAASIVVPTVTPITSPVRAASYQPQFADVVPAPPGMGREGCKEWYNRQGFSSREFWDEASETCK